MIGEALVVRPTQRRADCEVVGEIVYRVLNVRPAVIVRATRNLTAQFIAAEPANW